MDQATAQLLIDSLIGRLVPGDGVMRLPEGVLSAREVEALNVLVGRHREQERQLEPATVGAKAEVKAPLPVPSRHAVNDSAISRVGPPESEIRLCLDFGTAMSKAWATGRGVTEALPLLIGQQAGIGAEPTLHSSVYISQRGKIFFGQAADRQYRQEISPGRAKFENLKDMLTHAEVGSDLDNLTLAPGIDPTGSGLQQGDLLVLYLAWLTDMSLLALEETVGRSALRFDPDASIRSVRRRFAVPCFEDAVDENRRGRARAQWAGTAMNRAVVRAQLVADSLTGKWDELTVNLAKDILDRVREVDVDRLQHLLATDYTVREPIAAGASRFEDEIDDAPGSSVRRFLLVIDAGAGTTDFALFQGMQHRATGKQQYALITPSVRMSRIAGNEIDAVLRPIVLSACSVIPDEHVQSDERLALMRNDLSSQIRDIKASLLADGEVDIALKPNARGRLTRAQLMENPKFAALGAELKAVRDGVLRSSFAGANMQEYRRRSERAGKPIPVHVLITGGSATVPIVHDLGGGQVTIDDTRFAFQRLEGPPTWISSLPRDASELLARFYPQLAVAIGGSTPELPIEIGDMAAPIEPVPPGEFQLERFPITGNS